MRWFLPADTDPQFYTNYIDSAYYMDLKENMTSPEVTSSPGLMTSESIMTQKLNTTAEYTSTTSIATRSTKKAVTKHAQEDDSMIPIMATVLGVVGLIVVAIVLLYAYRSRRTRRRNIAQMNRQTARTALTYDFDHSPANSSPVLAVSNVSYSHEEIRINIPTKPTLYLEHKNSRSEEPESSSESTANVTKPEHVISNGSKGVYDRPRINKMSVSSYTDGPSPSSPDYDTPRSQLYKVLPTLTPQKEENTVPDIKPTLATLTNESDNNSEMDTENNDEIPPSYENCSPLKSIRKEKPLLVASGKYKRHTRGNERYKTHTCVISHTGKDENGDTQKFALYETLDRSVTMESQRANLKPIGKRLKSSKTIGNVNDLDACKDYVNLKEAIDDLSDNIYENCKRNLRSPGKTDHNKGSDSLLKPPHGERHIPSQKKKTPPAKLPKTFKNFKPNRTDPDSSKRAFIKNEASDQNNSSTDVEYENVSHLKTKKPPVSVRNKASSDNDANVPQANNAESNINNATVSNIFNKSDKKPKVESPLLTFTSKALLAKSKTVSKNENNGSESKDYENIEKKIEQEKCDDINNDKVSGTENAQEDLKYDNDESEFCKTKLQQSDSVYEEPDSIGSLKRPQSTADDTYYTPMKAGVHNFDLLKDLVQDDMHKPMSVLESTEQQKLPSHTSTDLQPLTSFGSTGNEDCPAPPPPCSGNYANLSRYVNVVHQ